MIRILALLAAATGAVIAFDRWTRSSTPPSTRAEPAVSGATAVPSTAVCKADTTNASAAGDGPSAPDTIQPGLPDFFRGA